MSDIVATRFERRRGLAAMLVVRERVIGALIMRELQTRFGRSNFGFIWLFMEPLMLGSMVGGIHLVSGGDHDMAGAPGVSMLFFFVIGYIPFFLFRAIVSRATTAVHANLSLLYHRDITLQDIIVSRNLLEFFAVAGVLVAMLAVGGWITGSVTQSPLKVVLAIVLMFFLAHGLSMFIAGATALFDIVDRIVHPLTYIMMPLSGAFFMVDTLPPDWQAIALLSPLVNINELLRDGQFGLLIKSHYDIAYVLQWILGVNFLGLMMLRVARPRLHMY